jgi:hypothetical protein
MGIKTKKGGAYSNIVGLSVKKSGTYAAVQGAFVKVGGVYQSVTPTASVAGFRFVTQRNGNNFVFA